MMLEYGMIHKQYLKKMKRILFLVLSFFVIVVVKISAELKFKKKVIMLFDKLIIWKRNLGVNSYLFDGPRPIICRRHLMVAVEVLFVITCCLVIPANELMLF